MSRQSRNQSTHDRRVRTLANQLKNEGREVQVDLPTELPKNAGEFFYV